MKAIIFARVSSLIQEKEGYSLDAQIEKLRVYALSKGYQVLQEFKITESSNISERKKFNKVIEFVKSERKKSSQRIVIISDKVDRLIRNFKDYPLINELIERDIAELHFVGESTVLHKDSTSTEKFMWNIRIVMAQNYIDSMKDHTKRSRDYKIEKGEWVCKAPLGYKNITKGKDNKSDVILDSERLLIVRRLFVEYSSGNHSIRQVTKLAEKWGLRSENGNRISQTTINSILKNKFYIGTMTLNGKEYAHRYERLIDDEVFYKCQAALTRFKRQQFRMHKNLFLFSGLLSCSKCGCAYSSEIKKGKGLVNFRVTYVILKFTRPKANTPI